MRLAGSDEPSGSNSFDQAVESKELDSPAIVLADEGWARIGGDDQQVRFGVSAGEDQQAGRVEIARRPFAFDGQRGLTSWQPDEVNLVTLLIAPDISASQGHVVPSAMITHQGHFYVGTLMPFPASPVAKVYRISLDGEISVVAEGLTTVLGIGFPNNQLYVLEASAPVTSPGPPVLPGTGRVVRVSHSGNLEPVVTGLTFPAAMTFSPEGLGKPRCCGSGYVTGFARGNTKYSNS